MSNADLATHSRSAPIAGWRQRHSGRMTLPAACHSRDLTDEKWALIEPFLPKLTRRKDGRGRPWRENRTVLNGILWILRTGAAWADLPDRYPPYQTCHRRFQTMGSVWSVEGHPLRACRGAPRRGLLGPAGGIHRRQFRARQERRCRRGNDEARQGIEDHGDRRSAWAARRYLH